MSSRNSEAVHVPRRFFFMGRRSPWGGWILRAVPVLVAVTCGLALFIAGLFGTSWGIDATKEAAANFNGQCPLGFLSPGCKTLYERQMQARTNAAIFGATLGLGVAVTLFGGLLEYRPRSVWGRDSYWLAAALWFI